MTAHAYGCAVKKINRRQNMTAHAYGCAVIKGSQLMLKVT